MTYCDTCAGPMTPQCPDFKNTIARKLSGYDDATWSKLREDRKRTYRRAADTLITQWPEFVNVFRRESE